MDPNNIQGARRARLIKLGRGWGSAQVKAQANAILGQLHAHQQALEAHGLLPQDLTELTAWVALYPSHLDDREDKRLGNTLTSRQLKALEDDAGRARRAALLRLREAEARLADTDDPASAEALRHLQAVLARTVRKPADDPEALAAQLKQLADALSLNAVMDIARPRGGEAALAALAASGAALSQAATDAAQRTSTTAQTEALDLLDGLIVERLREVARIGKAAAKAAGSPSLADAFKLKLLYG